MAEQQVDDCLLHEMVHAVREMEGLEHGLPAECSGFEPRGEEEFFAILVQNIYMSETRRTQLRKDHGRDAMSDALNNSQWFLGKGMGPLAPGEDEETIRKFQTMNRRLVIKFVSLHTGLALALAQSLAPFNPVREYLRNRSDYPAA
jgi:hypothetical protein